MFDTLLSNQFGLGVLVVYIIEWLKKSEWFPYLTRWTDKGNRMVAIVVAFLSSVGFEFALTGNWQTGGTLSVTLPSASTMLSVALHALTQAGLQESYYRIAVKK